VGRLLWGAEAKIVHPETGAAQPPGVPGEFWIRGPFVMKGCSISAFNQFSSKTIICYNSLCSYKKITLLLRGPFLADSYSFIS
jgi:acyl-CoA synthetase (AMP-forming)/AMP-acid ligase II